MLLLPGIIASSQTSFSPLSIANCKVWLDASDTSTISLSGSEVTQWTDKTANAYAFTQGTAANRPLSGTRSQNGKNIIDFDGSNDRLTSNAAASTWKFMNDGTEFTTFIALIADNQNTATLLSTNNGEYGKVGMIQLIGATKALEMGMSTGVSGTRVIDCATATNFADMTVFSYSSWSVRPTQATASERVAFRSKNGTASKPNAASGAVNNTNPSLSLSIGHTEGFINVPFNGGIGEILIYDALVSDSDRAKIHDYLVAKWNIT